MSTSQTMMGYKATSETQTLGKEDIASILTHVSF